MLVALAVPASGQQQFAELPKRGLPSGGAAAVALGDVDGDGDRDMVCGNWGQNQLYLNNGSGTFTDATAARMPVDSDNTTSVALGDVDGDGDLDMVFGNDNWQNRLYLNNGSGTFTDATAARMPVDNARTTCVALGDVDGDGDLDMVFGNVGQQNRLYLNNGGTFIDATAARMPVRSDYTTSVALGDVDGDGDLDMVFGNKGASWGAQNRLYLNNGSGTFTDATAARMPVDIDYTTSVALGDVDGDGDLDMVFGNVGQQNRLYLNNSGTFTDATAARMPVDSGNTTSVALGDVDGDGDFDMVFGNGTGQNRLYLNDGSGTFTDATAARMPADSDSTTSVALGDVDGDGDRDLVFGHNGDQNRLYLNNGSGTFADATAARMPDVIDLTTSVALGDVDGDGDRDMVCGNAGNQTSLQNQNRLYLNNGGGTFTDATAARMPVDNDSTNSVGLGDLDGDGDLDMVFGNWGQQNRLYLNNSGTFTDATAARMPVDSDLTRSVALGDVDGDGDLDMVFGNGGPQGGQQNRLYLNNGSGTFSDATAARMPVDSDSTSSVALGDIDGDGDLDMVFGNEGVYSVGGQNRLYLNNGSGTFSDATAVRMPVDSDYTSSVALGDVDGDGDLDMVFGNGEQQAGEQNRLYLNNGSGTFTDATAARMPVDIDSTRSVAFGDVDGDGDLDMVFGNWWAQNRLYLNNGSGTFSDATAARMPVDSGSNTTSVALGDVDSDGDVDMVFGKWGQQNRLYLNLLRQLDAPYLLRVGQTYTLEAYARYGPPSALDIALPYLSTTRLSIPVPPFGTLGISPDAPLGFAAIPPATGVASFTWNVPNLPAFVGLEVFAQALILSSSGQDRLTNVTADVLIQ